MSLKDKLFPKRSKDPKTRAEAEFRSKNDMVHGGPFLGELRPGKKGRKYRADMAEYVREKTSSAEGMFSNPSSEIPDEMWRAPAPMQRQVDAAVLWAELTGKHASGCGSHGAASKPKKKAKKATKVAEFSAALDKHPALKGKQSKLPDRIQAGIIKKKMQMKKAAALPARLDRALMAAGRNPEATGAMIGAPIGAGKAYTDYRPGKSGISKAEARIMGQIEEQKARGAGKEKIQSLRKSLSKAKERRENLASTTALGTGIGAGLGASAGLTQRFVRHVRSRQK